MYKAIRKPLSKKES